MVVLTNSVSNEPRMHAKNEFQKSFYMYDHIRGILMETKRIQKQFQEVVILLGTKHTKVKVTSVSVKNAKLVQITSC